MNVHAKALALPPEFGNKVKAYSVHKQDCLRICMRYSFAVQIEVRALAKAAGLPNQARRDSQGICFLGKVKFSEFVEQHLGVWPGCIVEEETGGVVGYHQGFWFHTVGQRRGIPLSGGPW